MEKAHQIFIEAFRINSVVRCLSAEYWLGVLHSLESQELALRGRSCELDSNPFNSGTHEARCWLEGQREGQRLWRINRPVPSLPQSYGERNGHMDS